MTSHPIPQVPPGARAPGHPDRPRRGRDGTGGQDLAHV